MPNESIILYHGGKEEVIFPEIRKTKYTKDFSWGFYCTKIFEQARKWAERKDVPGIVNFYNFLPKAGLKILTFEKMDDAWLDFIAECRVGKCHDYDIVEGPMADDTIWNFVNDFFQGIISRAAFWELAKFKYPTHQISFHTLQALDCLSFIKSERVKHV